MENKITLEEPIQSVDCSDVKIKLDIQKLIEDNLKFVYSTVNKNFSKYITNEDIREDLYQAGMFGLSYAANKFDQSRHNNKFITYAVYWIKYYVYQEVLKHYQIPLNQNHIYKRNKINKARTEFIEQCGREPTAKELSERLPDFSEKVIKNVLSINDGNNYNFISFQSITTNNKDSDKCDMENVLGGEIIEQSVNPETKYQVEEVLSILKQRVEPHLYDMFVAYYINGENYSEIATKNGLNFPASAKYYVNKVREEFKNIYVS